MADWIDYIDRFHHERPGVAADVLGRCRAGNHSPHQWLARAVSSSATRIVDVGCGSGPMGRTLAAEGRTVLGIDLSMNELRHATKLGPGPWARADARVLPVADGVADAVVSSVALAVIQPTGDLLDEVARVLRPGGLFAGIVPTYRPLNVDDLRLVSQLTARLAGPPRFPVRLDMSMGPLLAAHGLRKVEDARERYYFDVNGRADAEQLLHALYLPRGAQVKRVSAVVDWMEERIADHGTLRVPIPIRRVVAVKQRNS
ncbi:class I SAM-dependent methyltransferase [Propionibacteriaceae bacterium G1746]|uniref:class I SAM-dependent methyltransferase n=1 Tax=Aestuariimicrobium sp. G57 TaxID=3418485 RepID=UPI003C1470E0